MPKLRDFESQMIVLIVLDPVVGGLVKRTVKLVTVDDAGIWFEDQGLTNAALENLLSMCLKFVPPELLESYRRVKASEAGTPQLRPLKTKRHGRE
jgi:hypothetical protein